MTEQISMRSGLDKKETYRSLLPQVTSLMARESDLVANLANIAAALKQVMGFFWVGFYLVQDDVLVLGPFQGPVACTRIAKGKGVCGKAWARKEAIVVPDVDKFPGHIACSGDSRSEIVIPIFRHEEVVGVLDADSDKVGDFDSTDLQYLGQICNLITRNHFSSYGPA